MKNNYYPIRERAVWVGLVQLIITGLTLAGVGAEVLTGWSAWFVAAVDLAVVAGVLSVGVKSAEQNTTPVANSGEPLNPSYSLHNVGGPPEYRGR